MLAILALFAVLALIGVPTFALFGGASLALFLVRPEGAWASPGIDVFSARFAESPFLMVVPMFTFAGFVLAESRAPARLIELSRAWLGWLPGSLAAVCLLSSTFFATITGGSAATIVAVGGLTYPALLKQRYPDRFALGLITTAGALGALLPPSMLLIFYCIVAQLPVEQAVLAGVPAGLLSLAALMAYGGYVGAKARIPRSRFVVRRALRELWRSRWEVAIPLVLVVPVAAGVLRPQEAAALVAVYVVAVEVFIYRDLDLRKDLPRITARSMALLGAVMIILTSAVAFTAWAVQAEIPYLLHSLIEREIESRYVFLLALDAFLVLIGMFTDGMTAIVVGAPMVLPLASLYAIDPFHIAVIFLLNLEIGFVVPPVGMNLFVSSARFGKPLGQVCRATLPFIAILSAVLLVVTYFPWLSTVLPALVRAAQAAPS